MGWVALHCIAKKQLLSGANRAHGEPADAVVVAVRAEVRVAEAHVPCVAATVVRSRPVEAIAAHEADRSPVAAASGRQEDRTVRLQTVRPTRCAYHVAAEAGTAAVGAAQAVIARVPAVGQQNHAVHTVHLCLGIADAAACAARVEDVSPFLMRQRTPLVCRVATIAYRVVAPVGLASLVV